MHEPIQTDRHYKISTTKYLPETKYTHEKLPYTILYLHTSRAVKLIQFRLQFSRFQTTTSVSINPHKTHAHITINSSFPLK